MTILPEQSKREKRKYTKRHARFFKNGQLPSLPEIETSFDVEADSKMEVDEVEEMKEEDEESVEMKPELDSVPSRHDADETAIASTSSLAATPSAQRKRGYDWLSMIPTAEEINNRVRFLGKTIRPN